jgi:hypothetical protein
MVVLAHDAAALQRHQQHQSGEVARQHNIAAAAQHQPRQAGGTRIAHGSHQLRFALDPARKLRANVETEGVMRLQRIAGNERGGSDWDIRMRGMERRETTSGPKPRDNARRP